MNPRLLTIPLLVSSICMHALSIRQIPHSTLADTAGFAYELRVIENKLGALGSTIRDQLVPIEVQYYSFSDNTFNVVDTTQLYSGILIVHRCLVEDVKAIFATLQLKRFPIAKVIPVNCYGLNADSTGWNDDASMADNNTSAFNYRSRPTSPKISKHALGIAIDINPMLNPCRNSGPNGTVMEPIGGTYVPGRPGTLVADEVLPIIGKYGWSWGGLWPKPKDHQHIEKSKGRCEHLEFSNDLRP
ncbi:MAG: M15 family metallopeptidase [Flavobacteriales bacterium]|nr:M15 family metallopeptidase [Flavobacteriales bacterium]